MEISKAQEIVATAIKADPEAVIAAAIAFNPAAADVATATRKAKGPLTGVAASVVVTALQRGDRAANLVAFASALEAGN